MKNRIVYLDDEQDLCEIFRDIFGSDSTEVLTFSDPQMALAEVLRQAPDLVFLDYRLSGTTGEQVAIAMPSSIRKFLITGEINPQLSYPFEEVLKKPIEIDVIKEIIASL